MNVKWLLIVLLSCHMAIGYENERPVKMKTVDSIKSYPLRVSYANRNQPGKLLKVISATDPKTQKYKRENVDNVRGEMVPQSRKDILNIKQLSFHGRDRPSDKPINETNKTINEPHYKKNVNSSYETYHVKPKASQRKDVYSVPKSKTVHKKEYSPKVLNSVKETPPYVPDDSPFYPLMKPSPINVMPTQSPSFDTVRSYVQYLKMRKNKYFSDFDDDNQPSPEVNSKHSEAQYEGEIDYFKSREQELAREEELRNQFSPANFIKTIQSSDDVEHPNTDDSSASHESEITQRNSNEENAVINQRVDNHSNVDDATESDDYNNDRNNYYTDYTDESDNSDDESKKSENFVPFRLYAQVRHVESDHHEKPEKSNIKEKVSLAKKNIYYKEEGYEDKNYDHGAEKIDYDFKEKRNKRPKRKRSKRSANDNDINVSELPVALAYIKKSEIPQLTGEKLFNHLDELIKNSSHYLSDDDDTDRPIHFRSIHPSKKYPYYNTPEKILSQMSAHRYSENFKNYPRQKESLYEYKDTQPCEKIEENIDPVPKDIEEKGKRTKFNKSPKRLNNLGNKIQCFREKYFGKDPFDNPLFKEDEYVEATIPIPVNHNLSRQANPLITVYDDVIHNIRSGMVNDFKKKRESEDVLKQASEQIAVKAKNINIPNYSVVSGVSQLPLFDINTFLPKYRGSFTKFSEEDDEKSDEVVTSTSSSLRSRKRKRNNLILEQQNLDPPVLQDNFYIETSTAKRNNNKKKKRLSQLNTVPESPSKPIASSIKHLQPPKLIKTSANPKYRRYVIPPKHFTTITQQLPPPTNGKTTYRFKLL